MIFSLCFYKEDYSSLVVSRAWKHNHSELDLIYLHGAYYLFMWIRLFLWAWSHPCGPYLNSFQPSVAFHIEPSYLICRANQTAGFYMKCSTCQKSVNVRVSSKQPLKTLTFYTVFRAWKESLWVESNLTQRLVRFKDYYYFKFDMKET